MFGLQSYESLVTSLREEGFNFSTDWNIDSASRAVLMRHDIDFSIEDALAMAVIEERLAVTSTYFFMLSSNMYNLISKKNRGLVAEIRDMGHKISLHYDPTAHETNESFLQEREAFESAFEVEVDIVSIHRPGKFLENNNDDLFGIKQTYQDAYFKELMYLSDSGGRDILEPISTFLKTNKKQGLHLLIHPVWWVNKLPSQTETLNNWRTSYLEFITDEIRANCKTYEG